MVKLKTLILFAPLLLLPIIESYEGVYGLSILLFYTGILLLKNFKYIHGFRKSYFIFIILIVFFQISTFFSVSSGKSFLELIRLFCYFIMFVVVVNLPQTIKDSIKKYVTISIILNCIILSVFLLDILILNRLPPGFSEIPYLNLFFSSNGHHRLSIILLPAITLCLFMDSKRKNYVYFRKILLTFFIGMMILTFSRSGYIILGFIILIWSLKRQTKPLTGFIILIFFTMMIGIRVLSIVGANSSLISQKSYVFSYVNKPVISEQRFDYLLQAFHGVLRKPFFGWGPGTFYAVSTQFAQDAGYSTSLVFNHYVQLLAEIGIPGTFLFIILIVYLIYMVYCSTRHKHHERMWVLILSILTLHAGMDVGFSHISILLYFFVIAAFLLPSQGVETSHTFTTSIYIKFIAGIFSCISLLLIVNHTIFLYGQTLNDENFMKLGIHFLPINSDQYDYLSIYEFKTKNYNAALDSNLRARNLEPFNWIYYFHAYQIYGRMGLVGDKFQMVSKLSKLNPKEYLPIIENWDENESLGRN